MTRERYFILSRMEWKPKPTVKKCLLHAIPKCKKLVELVEATGSRQESEQSIECVLWESEEIPHEIKECCKGVKYVVSWTTEVDDI